MVQHARRTAATRREANQPSGDSLNVTASSAAALILGWLAVSLAAFAIADVNGVLDLPLGALLASQGALVAAVLIGVRLLRGR